MLILGQMKYDVSKGANNHIVPRNTNLKRNESKEDGNNLLLKFRPNYWIIMDGWNRLRI